MDTWMKFGRTINVLEAQFSWIFFQFLFGLFFWAWFFGEHACNFFLNFIFVTYGWQFAIWFFFSMIVVAACVATNQIMWILFEIPKRNSENIRRVYWLHVWELSVSSNIWNSRQRRVLFLYVLYVAPYTLTSIALSIAALSNDSNLYMYIFPLCVYAFVCRYCMVYIYIDTYYTVETGDTVERSCWCVERLNMLMHVHTKRAYTTPHVDSAAATANQLE